MTRDPAEHSRWRQFADYWREGVWHIWIGFDHILFLLALLLPAVLWREGGYQRGVNSFRSALLSVAGVVTAFTVAHSITLSAAVLGWVSLPSRWVESAIAATVLLAALNNLYPIIQGRLWPIAFCLGLIHGFGFASVLSDLGLPANALILALAGFNLGVETGQLAIVMADPRLRRRRPVAGSLGNPCPARRHLIPPTLDSYGAIRWRYCTLRGLIETTPHLAQCPAP